VDMDYDKDGHIKDKAVKALLDKSFKETCDESSHDL
ncbi:hypothetical protein NQ317_010481, partial [Molorchus minor]